MELYPQSREYIYVVHTNLHYFYIYCYICNVGRDGVVGITTRYRLGGPGIESWWERDFPHLSGTALRPTQRPIQWVPGLSRG
jgi:hypothetical protein